MRDRYVTYTPQQNGRAERFKRSLTQKARAMVLDAGIPRKYWGEAFNCVAMVYNLSSRLKQSKTLCEIVSGVKSSSFDLTHHVGRTF